MRREIGFGSGWRFAKQAEAPAVFPADWEEVTIPHCWNAKDGQDGGNDYFRGTCCYAKEFERPQTAEGERVFIEFGAASNEADVFVNGTKAIHHEGGFSAFRKDITDLLAEKNLITVLVDNSANDRIYPQKADFTFYGGIYRDVKLLVTDKAHFELEKDGSKGLQVCAVPDLANGSAKICVQAWANAGEKVIFTVCDSEGRQAAAAEAPLADGSAKAELFLENAHLWAGTADPYLYTCSAKLVAAGEEKDETASRFGIRIVACDPEKGFLLNGQVYPLRGVARHQDNWGVGNAITEEMMRRDMEFVKEIGANTLRLAHYQHAEAFYDLCDEEGIVVWAEIPFITSFMPNGRKNTIDQMRELITQCFNHPSIACWGLSNEITAASTMSEELLDNHRELQALCKKLDPTRPTTMAHAFMLETDSPLIPIADLASYNLYYGWYLGELSENEAFFDEYHSTFPDRVIGFSEYGADCNPALHSEEPERGDYSEEYQCVYHEHLLKCIEARPYMWATHVWNLFDFGADGRDEGGKNGQNQKGLVTIDRQLRKDAFFLYKAVWNPQPMLHLCGSRFTDRARDVIRVRVYSNLPEVSLYRDGECVGTVSHSGNAVDDRIFVFEVPISGEHVLAAKAGDLCEEIKVRRVEKENDSYRLMKTGDVVNWFDKDEFRPECFSIKDTLGELMKHPEAGKIVGMLMQKATASRGEVAQASSSNPVLQKLMAKMSLESLIKQAGPSVIKPEQIRQLNDTLQRIRKN